jgi:hypothetical protein
LNPEEGGRFDRESPTRKIQPHDVHTRVVSPQPPFVVIRDQGSGKASGSRCEVFRIPDFGPRRSAPPYNRQTAEAMRPFMTRRRVWWAASLAAAMPLLGSCANRPASSSSQPALPTSPGPTLSQLSVSTKCLGPFRPGDYAGLACVAFVSDTRQRAADTLDVRADLRIFGGHAEQALPKCPACGDPPTFDLDLHVPADITPGVKTFAVWVTDAQGRADTTATVEIVPR